jgi:addiction module HigA family antidote
MTIVFKTATHTVGDHLTDFMDELGIKAPTLAKHLAVPRSRIVRLIDGARRDGDMALRLARHFGTTPQYWINLQALRDLSEAQVNHGAAITEAITPHKAA